jgi:hypothetical protein
MGVTQLVSPTARGDSPVVRGRVIHSRSALGGGPGITSAAIALGVGWGDGTLVLAIASGSTDTKGTLTVTSVGSNQAQATATIALTFAGGAFRVAPVVYANRNGGTGGATIGFIATATTTVLTITACVIPVDTKTYTVDYLCVPVDEAVN